jgi:hypothetical protein
VSVHVIFDKMEKIEYCGVIKFSHLKGNTPTQIKAELDTAPSFAT